MAAIGALCTEKSCSYGPGGQSSEFISASSELFLDGRPDHHLLPLEGMALVRKKTSLDWIFNPDLTLQTRSDKQTLLWEPSLNLSLCTKYEG